MLGAMAAAGIGGVAGCTTGEGTETTTEGSGGDDGNGDGGTDGTGEQTTTRSDVSASGTVKIGVMQPMSGGRQY